MATYLPFAGKNSIVEATFGLQFAQSLDSHVAANFEQLRAEFLDDFPSFEKMQVLQIVVGMQHQSDTSPSISGFNASRFKADGKPSRVLRAMNTFLSSHFLEYDHWAETKESALHFFERCLKILKLPSNQNPIVGVSLRFIDRFTFDGAPAAASGAQLLNSATKYVAPKVLNVGNLWHSNSGWFDTLLGSQKVLHQLNVQGQVEQSAVIIVNHNIGCSLDLPFTSVRETEGDNGCSSLDAIFNAKHEANAAVLKDLLNENMLTAIGLGK